jgi:ornithine carbamoyltransferase
MFKIHESNIKSIRQGDAKFMLQDGMVVCPRAGFDISQSCPKEYRMIILECMNNGWLKPVAHVYGKELTMDALR